MTENYLLTPLNLKSDKLRTVSVDGLTGEKLITTKSTGFRQEILFLEDGNTTVELGFRGLNPSRYASQEIAINGSKVAWDSSEGGVTRIKYFNGTSTVDLGTGIVPKFYKQGIAWVNETGLQYFNGQTTQQLSSNSAGNPEGIEVSGNNIAWVGSNGTNTHLYLYDGTTTKQITTAPLTLNLRIQPEFQISGNRVVWSTAVLDANGVLNNSNRDVYYFDGSQTKQLTNAPGSESQVGFYQNKPIWVTNDDQFIQQIFTYENGKVKQITNDPNGVIGNYSVVDGLLAWDSYDSNNNQSDVYAYNGTKVIALSNTIDRSESIAQGPFDRLYWTSEAGKFTYTNGQVQQLDLGEGNYGLIGSNNGKLLVDGFQGTPEDPEFAGIYRGTVFDSQKIKRGTAEDDRLTGTLNSNIIYGLDGDDRITGNSGTDNLYGGKGEDTIDAKGGDDVVFGGDGDDVVNGEAGNDVLVGGNGDDTLRGGAGNDRILGNNGNDEIEGGDGNDLIEGNAGDDEIRGGNGNDTIKGGTGMDNLYGGEGNDSLTSDGGGDIFGGGGNDYIAGGESGNYIEGGDGDDTLFGGYVFNVPNLIGGEIAGGNGNDSITGRLGDDELSGGAGNDTIDGFSGNDALTGGNGNDILIGGDGDDQLTGGAGSDTFVFGGFGISFATAAGVDQITDFNAAADKMRLDRAYSGPDSLFGNTVNFAAVAKDDAVATSTAQIVYSKSTGNLFYNANGAEAGLGFGAEFATLTNRPQNLTASNFTVT
jgi:Ca2+-binding RTX toxin-like protein